MVSGSAPISAEVLRFLRVAFGCPIIEGYGQTENCAAAFMTYPEDKEIGHCGGPLPCIDYKLVDVPEMQYLSTDLDEIGNSAPRGEICVRGLNVFKGYYKNPEETEATIDEEGWLHSGDIGIRLHHNGALKIIDRKKNIFKLSQGEYVSAEKIESVCSTSPYVAQIFVYGDSFQSYLVAIVIPDETFVRKQWCVDNGVPEDMPIEELCQQPKLQVDALNDITATAKTNKLMSFETPRKLYLSGDLWTPENILTPTMKLKRHDAKQMYQTVIDTMYEAES
jgi:long-chain acyl-CoA synthetase